MTAADVRAWRVGFAAWLERAVLEASGMGEDREDETDADGIKNPKPADYSPPDHSLIASGDQPSPRQDLSTYRESDTVYGLVDMGVSPEEINRLLVPEIEQLHEGVDRAKRRSEKERD